MRTAFRVCIPIACTALLVWVVSMYEVYSYPKRAHMVEVDAVIVLGAAAWGNRPSPVFRERINHAVNLYNHGFCQYIIFTGGKGYPQEPGESVIAREYAVRKGVKRSRTLIENKSKNTFENLYFAREVAQKRGLFTFAVVSDPYHLKRASLIAQRLGMNVIPSPTPSTRFVGREKKMMFLMRETYYLILYRLDTLVNGN